MSDTIPVILTKNEEKGLREFLYNTLMTKSEYHTELHPRKKDGLAKLMLKYFYWGDKYNDGYIPEERETETNRIFAYLAQEFKRFLEIPVSIRY